MTSKISIDSQRSETSTQRAAGATPGVQELLTAVAEANRESNLESLGMTATPAPSDATDAFNSLVADLKTMVERIRGQYQTLADMEIRRALGAALSNVQDAPLTGESPVASLPTDADPFGPAVDELQAMVGGAGETSETGDIAVPPDDLQRAPAEEGEGVYEGTVLSKGSMQRVVRFVDDLCQRP